MSEVKLDETIRGASQEDQAATARLGFTTFTTASSEFVRDDQIITVGVSTAKKNDKIKVDTLVMKE